MTNRMANAAMIIVMAIMGGTIYVPLSAAAAYTYGG